jgi:hypothetical protein
MDTLQLTVRIDTHLMSTGHIRAHGCGQMERFFMHERTLAHGSSALAKVLEDIHGENPQQGSEEQR